MISLIVIDTYIETTVPVLVTSDADDAKRIKIGSCDLDGINYYMKPT